MVAWTCQRQGRPLDCSTSSSDPRNGPGANSEEKREPVSDIDIAVADSLKVLDLKRPIREATKLRTLLEVRIVPNSEVAD